MCHLLPIDHYLVKLISASDNGHTHGQVDNPPTNNSISTDRSLHCIHPTIGFPAVASNIMIAVKGGGLMAMPGVASLCIPCQLSLLW